MRQRRRTLGCGHEWEFFGLLASARACTTASPSVGLLLATRRWPTDTVVAKGFLRSRARTQESDRAFMGAMFNRSPGTIAGKTKLPDGTVERAHVIRCGVET